MRFEDGLAKSEQAYNQYVEVSSKFAHTVMEHFLFTWQWWLGIALFIFPWVVWIKVRNKKSTGRLLFAGLLTTLLSLTIDFAALSKGLWSYPLVVIPLAPFLFLPYHFSLAPVGIMLALQYKPEMNPIFKGIVFAAIAAFGGMNLFNAISFYNPKNWSTFFDFFIFLTLYFAAYGITKIDSFSHLDKK